jgi:hypothetical protein
MKRLIFSLAATASFMFAFGQGEMDVLKYTQTDILGTARYTSMGGALGALGGDVSAITDNPAALGIYRSFDINLTPGLTWTNTSSGGSKEFGLGGTFDNFGFVASFLTGRDNGAVAHNIGINYNRLRNFRNNISTSLNDSPSSLTDYMASDNSPNALWELGWEGYLLNELSGGGYESILNSGETVNKRYYSEERGSVGEWDFSYAINISNIAYLGATLGVQTLDYRLSSTHSENFANNRGFDLYNDLETAGNGVNFKIGGIVRPVDFLRVGVSFTTPTVYSLEDRFRGGIDYDTSDKGSYRTDWGVYDYTLTTPYKVMGSLGFVIGTKAVIGVNYEMSDYSIAKLGDKSKFSSDNDLIKKHLTLSHRLKVGAEYRLTDRFSLRAGYAMTTSPVKPSVEDNQLEIYPAGSIPAYSIPQNYSQYSLGFGYRGKMFYFDAAYVLNQKDDHLYLYPNNNVAPAESIKTQTLTSNLIATVGFRF